MTQRSLAAAATVVCLILDVRRRNGGVDAFVFRSSLFTSTRAVIADNRKERDVHPAMTTSRVNFDAAWDNSRSPHVANGCTKLDQGNMLWQYAYHGNWHEVSTRICSHPSEARYVRENGWTPLHLLVAGNGSPVPLMVVKAVYDAFPGALGLRTNDYNRTPLDIAKRWNQRQDIIDFLSNPETLSQNSKSISGTAHGPKDAIHVEDGTLLTGDDTNDAASTTRSTAVDADIVDTRRIGVDQQPTRSNYRSTKPLSADAIVITNLQRQHNDFVKETQTSKVESFPMGRDLSQPSTEIEDDKTKIMKLELENHRLKETEKEMQTKLQEAQQRMGSLEEDLTRRHKAEIENRVNDIQNGLQLEINTLKKSKAEAISRLKKDLEKSKATEDQMRIALIASNDEIESLKLDLDNSKVTEKQTQDAVDAATAELDMALQRLRNLEGEMDKLQQRSQAEAETPKHTEDSRFVHMQKEINMLKDVKDQLRIAFVAANSEVQEAQNQVESIKDEMRSAGISAKKEVEEAQSRLDELEERFEAGKTKILSLQRDLEKSRETEEQMRSAVVSANVEFREARSRWECLEDQFDTLASSEQSLLTQVERLSDQLKQKQLECLVLEEDKKALRREFELKLYKVKNPDPKQRSWHDGHGTRYIY